MLQNLPIVMAQVKARNTSENLPNKIGLIINSLYREKEITKNVYKNIINSIKTQYKMDAMFMSSANNKSFDPYRLLLNLSNKINLKRSDKYFALSNPSIYYTPKNVKS